MSIRVATADDLDFLDRNDPLLTREVLEEKVAREEVYVAEEGGRRIGLARFDYLCDLDPFLTLLLVLEKHRKKGVGTRLMDFWEEQMKREGHRILLTSTEAAEDAQFFYRKIGFRDAGAILFPGQEAAELVLVKRLVEDDSWTGPRQKASS